MALLQNTEKTFQRFQSPYNKVEKLVFLIQNTNPRFFNFTELDFQGQDYLYYFNNLHSSKAEPRLLHPGNEGVDDSLLIRSVFKVFELPVASTASQPTMKLLDAHGQVQTIDAEQVQDLRAGNGTMRFSLPHLPDGKYDLSIDQEQFPIYLSAEPLHRYFGVVELFVKNAAKGNELMGKTEMAERTFALQFQNRATYWRYFLIDQAARTEKPALSEPQVNQNGTKLKFSKPEEAVLPNGQVALMIESEEPLPLEELMSNKEVLTLKVKHHGKWLPKPIRLPKPTVDIIKPDRSTNKIYSEVFVYF